MHVEIWFAEGLWWLLGFAAILVVIWFVPFPSRSAGRLPGDARPDSENSMTPSSSRESSPQKEGDT